MLWICDDQQCFMSHSFRRFGQASTHEISHQYGSHLFDIVPIGFDRRFSSIGSSFGSNATMVSTIRLRQPFLCQYNHRIILCQFHYWGFGGENKIRNLRKSNNPRRFPEFRTWNLEFSPFFADDSPLKFYYIIWNVVL